MSEVRVNAFLARGVSYVRMPFACHWRKRQRQKAAPPTPTLVKQERFLSGLANQKVSSVVVVL